MGGMPTDAPDRPVTPAAYPAIYDLPPPRNDAVLNATQQQQIQDDLMAAQAQQARRSGAAVARDTQYSQ
jgi:hypothetical protein